MRLFSEVLKIIELVSFAYWHYISVYLRNLSKNSGSCSGNMLSGRLPQYNKRNKYNQIIKYIDISKILNNKNCHHNLNILQYIPI